MAETTLTATALAYSDGVAEFEVTPGIGTAINTANTMRVLCPKHNRLVLFVDSNHASTALTLAAGDFSARSVGAKTYAVANTKGFCIFVDDARFKDSDGYVSWSWATDSAGTVQAYEMVSE